MFKQYSDWIGVHDFLCTGGVSYSECFTAKLDEEDAKIKDKGILKIQEEFQNECLIDVKVE